MRRPPRQRARRPPIPRHLESKLINSRGGSRKWSKTVADYIRVNQICWLRLPGCTIRSQTIDHYHTRKHRPDLTDSPSNYRPACLRCNRARRDTPPHLIPRLRGQMEARRQRPPSKALGFFG